jgi:adenine/guanine phosphoribosyltransferase-like PRPP-binding protein
MSLPPHGFWQDLHAPGTLPGDDAEGYGALYPARLPDGRGIAFPVRVLPGDGTRAVASLILNQASFAVQDALADAVAAVAAPHAPDVVAGLPTLGLGLAGDVARRLGHPRMVALGTSRKFWYDEALSVPVASITSPGEKRIWLDPRMLPLLGDRRVLLVDDAISTGRTALAALALLDAAGVRPVAMAVAMAQGTLWRAALAAAGHGGLPVVHAVATPRLALDRDGRWRPEGWLGRPGADGAG